MWNHYYYLFCILQCVFLAATLAIATATPLGFIGFSSGYGSGYGGGYGGGYNGGYYGGHRGGYDNYGGSYGVGVGIGFTGGKQCFKDDHNEIYT